MFQKNIQINYKKDLNILVLIKIKEQNISSELFLTDTLKKKLQRILFGKINLTSISIILKKLKMLTLIGMIILDLKLTV